MTELSQQLRVFISYSWRDKGFVTSLCEHLRLLNVPIWLDRLELDSKSITYTDAELSSLIRSGLMECSAAVVVLNEPSINSRWVAYEIATAQEIMSQQPDFQFVGLATEELQEGLANRLLGDAPVIDFSSGYKTALADLGCCLTREVHVSSGYGVQNVVASATRRLSGEVTFSSHVKSRALPDERISRLIAARDELARLEEQPRVTDVVGLIDTLDADGGYDLLMSGNLPFRAGEPGDQYALAVSFLPTISASPRRPPSINDRVGLVLLSIWPSAEDPCTANLTTLMGEYNQDGSCYLWLSHDSHVHRYTLGTAEFESVLLSEDREMGDRECAIRWPNNNLDENLIQKRQALANKLGLGQVQQGQEFEEPRGFGSAYTLWMMANMMEKQSLPPLLTQPRGWVSDVWNSTITDKWQQPETSQTTALLGFLKMGGVFLFEVSSSSSVSHLLATQLRQVVQCSGGHVHDVSSSGSDGEMQYLCTSPQWMEVVGRQGES